MFVKVAHFPAEISDNFKNSDQTTFCVITRGCLFVEGRDGSDRPMYLFRVEHILTEREVQELITACGKIVEKYNSNKVTQTPLHVHVIVYNIQQV